jgi:integrase
MVEQRKNRKRRGRGEGAIYQRADGLWAGSVSLGLSEDGRRRRKVVYGATKGEVQEGLRQLQIDHSLGRLTDATRFTVGDFLTLWLETIARVKVSPCTYDRYKLVVERQLKPHLAGVRLDKLTGAVVSMLDAKLERAGASTRTRQMTLTVLHGAMRDAIRKKFIVANPVTDVPKPRVVKTEMKTWTQAQVQTFLDAAKADRLYALYVLALDAGMRQGELFGLHWPDVDFDAGAIQVQRTLSEIRGAFALKPPKTAAGRRRVELSTFAQDALHEHRKRMLAEGRDVKTGLVFCDEGGKFLRKSNVSRRSFRSVVKRANRTAVEVAAKLKAAPDALPQIRFHDLRHTHATLLLAAGENIKVVAERLGHEDIEITLKHYAHVMPGQQKGAAEKMQKIFTAAADRFDLKHRASL